MKTTITVILAGLCMHSFAQDISFEQRIELELHDDFRGEEVYTFGSNGIVMRAESKKWDDDGNTTWKYDIYDTDLKLRISVPVKLKHNIGYEESYVRENFIHELFIRRKKGKYYFVTIEASTGKLYQVEGELGSRKMRIYSMKVMGDMAFIYGSLKREPVLFTINWKTGDKSLVPIHVKGVKPKKLSYLGMQLLEESDEVFVYLNVPRERREYETCIMRLSATGEVQEVIQLTDHEMEEIIMDISARKVGSGHYIYTGTYSNKSLTTRSVGLFFAESEDGKQTRNKFYKFTEFENFFSYLSEKKQERLEKKKKRKEKRGKELKLSYSIADHEMLIIDDGYLFIGEAYYPTYYTTTTTTYSNGVPTTTTTRHFDGYQYTHAVITKFNKEGDLVWDQTFEMWSAKKPFYVKHFISIQEEKANSIDLAYASHNRIHSMSIDFDGTIAREDQSDEIETGFAGDDTKSSTAELEYWYDDFFVTFGSQKIKNKEQKDVKKKRKVYFIQKIKF